MIQVHHLNRSRSTRVIWLLEELGVPYEVVRYERDPVTNRAPDELKAIHPLGKAPAIRDGDAVLVESGAIVEYLLRKYGNGRLAPAPDSPEYPRYLQWLHFAEGSAMLPLLLNMFLDRQPLPEGYFLTGFAADERRKLLDYLESSLQGQDYLLGAEFTAADIMMITVLQLAWMQGALEGYRNLPAYLGRLQRRPAFQKAAEYQ